MALNQTVTQMKGLLAEITHDLEKSDRGNKAASQRVRTGTIKLEKVAKLYRKESVKWDKQNKGRKKSAAPKKGKTAAKAKPAGKAKPATKAKPAAKVKAKPAAKAKTTAKAKPTANKKNMAKRAAGARAMAFTRRRSAKLPTRGMSLGR
jgi:hypothetical protein